MEVPAMLLSGDHAKIAAWRRADAIVRTCERRPDLIAAADLTDKERQRAEELLERIAAGEDSRAAALDLFDILR